LLLQDSAVEEASGGDLATIYSLQSQLMTMQQCVARGGHFGLSSAVGIVDGMCPDLLLVVVSSTMFYGVF
jgi:hypothetical protein